MVSDNKIQKLAAAAATSGRRTRITIETHTRTIISTTGLAFCDTCGREVVDIAIEQAAAVFGISVEELELFRESGDLHKTAAGGLCTVSLATHLGREISIGDDPVQK
jgi:hypothetical protein